MYDANTIYVLHELSSNELIVVRCRVIGLYQQGTVYVVAFRNPNRGYRSADEHLELGVHVRKAYCSEQEAEIAAKLANLLYSISWKGSLED